MNDITYSHIINPFTGSAISKHETVIVLNEDATLMDVYSTVFMMLETSEITKIANENSFKVIVVDDGKVTYKNSEIELYV